MNESNNKNSLEKNQYVDPSVINKIITDKLKLGISYEELKEKIRKVETEKEELNDLKNRCLEYLKLSDIVTAKLVDVLDDDSKVFTIRKRLESLGIDVTANGDVKLSNLEEYAEMVVEKINELMGQTENLESKEKSGSKPYIKQDFKVHVDE